MSIAGVVPELDLSAAAVGGVPVAGDGAPPGSLIDQAGQLQYGSMLMGVGTRAGWVELVGWRSTPGADVGDNPRPQAHGAYAGSVFGQSLVVTFTALVTGRPEAKLAALQTIEANTRLDGVDRPLVVDDGSGPQLRMARVIARELPQDKHFQHGPVQVSVQFLCADPRRYTLRPESALLQLGGSEGGLAYDAGHQDQQVNLATNPSFEVSTAGWVGGNSSAIARLATDGAVGGSCLQITSSTTNFCGAYTVNGVAGYPVTEGRTYQFQARFKPVTTARTANVNVYWYRADGTQITALTVASAAEVAGQWVLVAGSMVAPDEAVTGAVYLQAASPVVGEQHLVDAVAVVESDTPVPYFDGNSYGASWDGSSGLSTSRRVPAAAQNLVPNPTFGVDTSQWVLQTAGMVQVSDAEGTHAQVTSGGTGNAMYVKGTGTGALPIQGGTPHTFRGRTKAMTTARIVEARAYWYDGAGQYLASGPQYTELGNTASNAVGTWTDFAYTVTPPAGAKYCTLWLRFLNAPSGEVHLLDRVLVAAGSDVAYFDGDTPGAAWDGAPHESTSTRLTVTLGQNLCTNPSFEKDLAGWTKQGALTIARSAAAAYAGSTCMLVTRTSSVQLQDVVEHDVPTRTGVKYTVSARFKRASAGTVPVGLLGRQAGTADVLLNLTDDEWHTLSYTFTAVTASLALYVGPRNSTVVGTACYVDAVQVVEGDTAVPYFDGDSDGAAWDGVPHASTSSLLATEGLEYDQGLDYGTWSASGAQVLNSGSEAAPLQAVFRGPLQDPALRVGDYLLRFMLNLAAGESLHVDTDAGTVLLNGITDRLPTISNDSDPLELVALPPGRTDVQLTAASGTGTAAVAFRHASM